MKTEFEAKWIEFPADLKDHVKKAGFQLKRKEFMAKRYLLTFPGIELQQKWVRVRDEGQGATFAVKQKVGDGIDGIQEFEMKIESFDKGMDLTKAIGLNPSCYVETRREIWEKDGVEVMFDEWPGLPMMIEVESIDEESVQKAASEIGLDWDKAAFGMPDEWTQKHLGISMKEYLEIPELTFDNPPKKKEK